MKRGSLLRHLRKHGCHLKREGASHSLWTNPATGVVEAVARHTEIPNQTRLEHLPSAINSAHRLPGCLMALGLTCAGYPLLSNFATPFRVRFKPGLDGGKALWATQIY